MQNKGKELILIAQRMRAMSQTALVYSTNDYEIERCHEMIVLSDRIVSLVSGLDEKEISADYHPAKEYVTPKMDVRAVIINQRNEILLVKEKADGKWSLPGGWSDVGYTPKELIIKETKEETGYDVRVVRLLAIFDKRCHNHPASPFYIYKLCFECEVTTEGEGDALTFDILDKGYFPLNQLPPLSMDRILPEQIAMLYELRRNPQPNVYCD